eukprot:11037622-Alexandrium_andersonii.AAC.1
MVLMQLALQLPPHLRWPEEAMCCDFAAKYCAERAKAVGSRIAYIKGREGWDSNTGEIKMKIVGCYTCTFTATGFLEKVLHTASGTTATIDPARCPVNKHFKLVNNHSDTEAALVMEPIPPAKLIGFFEGSLGPNAYQ